MGIFRWSSSWLNRDESGTKHVCKVCGIHGVVEPLVQGFTDLDTYDATVLDSAYSSISCERRGFGAFMDPLRKNDLERFRRMSADERMKAVFETVNTGIRIQMAALRQRRPGASDGEIEAHLRNWLKDERTKP